MKDKSKPTAPVSRRRILQVGGYAVGVAAMIAITADAEAQIAKKATHATAGYRDTPMGAKSCSSCRHFQPPASCQVVESPVSGEGYCNLYAKKA